MHAIIFPGQGSQAVGMGSELYKNFDLVKKIFKVADEKLKFKLSNLIINGPENDLKMTQNTQPAILTVSYAIFSILKEEFNFNLANTKFFAGHSLGEYSALVCAKSLKFEDAISLVFERGKAMQEAVPLGKGGMLAILGQPILEIEKYLKEKKIKSIPLKVSAPFHCSLMKPAADYMKDKIEKIEFKKPKFRIISNVTAEPLEDPENIKKLLIKQIYSSVKWRDSILRMAREKIRNFIEIGPGKVLTGMVKRTIKDVNCFSINSIADIKNLKNEFKK